MNEYTWNFVNQTTVLRTSQGLDPEG